MTIVMDKEPAGAVAAPPSRRVVEIGEIKVGAGHFATIAGPCTVESREGTLEVARAVRDAGVPLLRGGAFKPRTSPGAFQGLGREGLEILAEAKAETGLPVVTEALDARDIEAVAAVADAIQIGARNMQNYALLTEVGRAGLPVLLKRGLSARLEELVSASEYIRVEGNDDVLLCERGIRTFETAYRFTLDLLAVPVLQGMTDLPVIVDPSHAAGRRDLVPALAAAAASAGADGIIVEAHEQPEEALCDGPQQIRASELASFAARVNAAAELAGKRVSRA